MNIKMKFTSILSIFTIYVIESTSADGGTLAINLLLDDQPELILQQPEEIKQIAKKMMIAELMNNNIDSFIDKITTDAQMGQHIVQ